MLTGPKKSDELLNYIDDTFVVSNCAASSSMFMYKYGSNSNKTPVLYEVIPQYFNYMALQSQEYLQHTALKTSNDDK